MPIGIFASGGGGDASASGNSRAWEDDGSVPVDLYVNNLIGDDDSFDGTSPTIGAGTSGPFFSIQRALDEVPIEPTVARIIHVATTGTSYTLQPLITSMNMVTVKAVPSIASSNVIASVNSSSRANGLDLTISAGMVVDTHRGKLVDFTSGSMTSRFGWIYSNTATRIQMSQDTPGSSVYTVPSIADTLDILSLDVEVSLPVETIITGSTGAVFDGIRFTGAGSINTLNTDKVTFQYCKFECNYLKVGDSGDAQLLCCYLVPTGHVDHGLLGVLPEGHLFLNRGTVLDSLSAPTHKFIRALQASLETDSEVIFKEVGEIRLRGTNLTTRNAIEPGEHTWRFIDCTGIVGNDDEESAGGHWDLPVSFGNVLSTYFLTGIRGIWGRIAATSVVTTLSVSNAVSADGGSTAVADGADYTYFTGGSPAGVGNPKSFTSLEGVSNYGGNIDLVPSDSIVITPNDATNEIIIGESHSGDLANPHQTKQIQNFLFDMSAIVPAGGTAYLFVGTTATSSVPVILVRPGVIRGASIGVNIPDATNTYALQILINGVVVATLTLASGVDEASTDALSVAVVANDDLAVRLVRTAGAGGSDFNRVIAYVDILET